MTLTARLARAAVDDARRNFDSTPESSPRYADAVTRLRQAETMAVLCETAEIEGAAVAAATAARYLDRAVADATAAREFLGSL